MENNWFELVYGQYNGLSIGIQTNPYKMPVALYVDNNIDVGQYRWLIVYYYCLIDALKSPVYDTIRSEKNVKKKKNTSRIALSLYVFLLLTCYCDYSHLIDRTHSIVHNLLIRNITVVSDDKYAIIQMSVKGFCIIFKYMIYIHTYDELCSSHYK